MDERALVDGRPVPRYDVLTPMDDERNQRVTVTSPLVIRIFATSNTPEMRRTENPAPRTACLPGPSAELR